MSSLEDICVGVVGVCGGVGRGRQLVGVINGVAGMRVAAVCDIDAGKLAKTAAELGVEKRYAEYEAMLDSGGVDAVFLATPMDLHVPQSIAALRRGIHVLCEVTAATDVQQCRDLVAACKASRAVYMMAENYNYNPPVAAVREMVLAGQFGTPYYAEGGYVADIKSLTNLTPWRRKWQLGVNGIPYIAHNLGPMLQWMPGRRVTSVCCSGCGHHYADDKGKAFEAEDSCTMFGRLDDGGQVIIRSDFLSDRPGIGVYNHLQGTEGCYESTGDRVWLRSRSPKPQWTPLAGVLEEFLPEYWKKANAEGLKVWGDHFQVGDFARAIRGEPPFVPMGVHESMDITLPGLMSQLSIAAGGRWTDVPDTRAW